MAKKDSLKEYRAKRDFSRSPEPSGTHQDKRGKGPIFVIQKHDARKGEEERWLLVKMKDEEADAAQSSQQRGEFGTDRAEFGGDRKTGRRTKLAKTPPKGGTTNL